MPPSYTEGDLARVPDQLSAHLGQEQGLTRQRAKGAQGESSPQRRYCRVLRAAEP
jgi:hypothetical protein